MKTKIAIGLLVVLVLIQFIRPDLNQGEAATPQDITHAVQVPDDVMLTLKTSCYDCHSNHTNYPWYASINPVGMWLGHHIEEGKEELNFSTFAQYPKKKQDHKLEEIGEELEEGHMPLPAYTLIHTDTKLSEQQVKRVVEWVNAERQKLGVASEAH
ncbi:heme-binding domain-containing protein [Nibrella viscosa]|uniref:Heme-binding domain-containing protein n=1 Tax=Nibrella viscosa TaxID=1084524 RepID=A0ABP8KUY5_9BACT